MKTIILGLAFLVLGLLGGCGKPVDIGTSPVIDGQKLIFYSIQGTGNASVSIYGPEAKWTNIGQVNLPWSSGPVPYVPGMTASIDVFPYTKEVSILEGPVTLLSCDCGGLSFNVP